MHRVACFACAVLVCASASAAQPPPVPEPSIDLPPALARVLTDFETADIVGAYAPQKGDADGGKFTLTLVKGGDGRWLIAADMDRPYRRTP